MNKKYAGQKAKRNGEHFERLLEITCGYYKKMDVAHIQKTPEPMKQIATLNKRLGHFKAHYVKKAQPDFQGTLKSGKSIVFEAKHTSSTRLPFDRINSVQEEDLAYHSHLGAKTFILISFNIKRFYAVSWEDWKHLKENSGKKSVNENDLVDYTISTEKGILDFLEEYR